eukprot:scaffold401_cov399-Prasinococcus_capsulatus_cf.AAC.6
MPTPVRSLVSPQVEVGSIARPYCPASLETYLVAHGQANYNDVGGRLAGPNNIVEVCQGVDRIEPAHCQVYKLTKPNGGQA